MRNKIIRSLLATCISAASFSSVYAQPAIPRDYVEMPGWSMGINFGLADLWGDVGTQSMIDHYINEKYWGSPHFMGGLFVRYVGHPALGVRASVNYGTLYANDNWNYTKAKNAKSIEDDAYQRYLRNQDIKSIVWEGSLMLEINPFRINVESNSARKRMQPYIVGGVAALHFKPKTTLVDKQTRTKKWVNVSDLHLEGEGFDFETSGTRANLWQLTAPVGLGLRWDLNEQYAFGVEYLYRFTMTDRLDMVSSDYVYPELFDERLPADKAAIAHQVYDKSWVIEPSVKNAPETVRGNNDVNDSYSTISFTIIYKIKSKKIPWWN